MSWNARQGTNAGSGKRHRAAVVSVTVATLFGLVGAGTAAAETAAPAHPSSTLSATGQPTSQPGPCTREEVGKTRIGPDGKVYVCRPRSSAGNDSTDDGQRLTELATDPTSGGEISTRSMRKARAVLGLEKAGLLPAAVRRDPTGTADFIDGAGVSWKVHDVKSSQQASPNLQTTGTGVAVDLLSGENVILITDNLSDETTEKLSALVASAGLSHRVLLWPGVRTSA